MFIFLPLINNSVATVWSFLLLITSVKTIRTFLSFPGLYSLILFRTSFISFEYSGKVFGSFRCFRPTSSRFLWDTDPSICMDLWHSKHFIYGEEFRLSSAFVFLDSGLPTISILFRWSEEFVVLVNCVLVYLLQ